MNFSTFNIICGHYGCGKTNLSINLAVDMSKSGTKVTLVDLDLVNPYFRSSDYKHILDEYDIKLLASNFAHTNLDIPSLPAEMYSILYEEDRSVIIDVGGDDMGATALGRFAAGIKENKADYKMYYVVNKYRPQTEDVGSTVDLLKEIESASRLKACGVINNSHLQNETDKDTILSSINYAKDIEKSLNIPLIMTTTPRALYYELKDKVENLYPLDIYVSPPW